MAMDLDGISVSSGSACSSGSFKPSHVLAAMGFDEGASKSALRFSTGWATTDADIDAALAAYARMVVRIKK
jgi:cysteine desulfurase